MRRRDDSGGVRTPIGREDSQTDGLDLSAVSESGLTHAFDWGGGGREREEKQAVEATVILIAHPDGKRLGTRYRLTHGSVLDIGRSPSASVSLPEVLSISRRHARLRYGGSAITVEDLGSTNGTYINGQLISGVEKLESGDRFQVGAVHFKLLHEMDVEHAYYEAIYDLVTRDGLTDIFNRRKYSEEAEREFARAGRHGRPLALVLFDLDDFKGVNDCYGHLCGDFVLKKVASVTREVLRPEQVFARIGGDEFVVLTPETGSEGALQLAEKLRERIASLDYRFAGVPVEITCSFGVAELAPEMKVPDDLFSAADQALYRSKHDGRNRVSLYRPDS